jgi:cob(I)alamin adenosyltransferase
MPRIYTKTGDDGTTGLLYGGRVAKDDLVTEAYGTTDEAVAVLGLARALSADPALAADLLTLEPEVSLVTDTMVARLEHRIDDLVERRPLPDAFVVPGANPASAALDVARSVVRRAERQVVALGSAGRAANPEVRRYLNRLSDLLFVLARWEAGASEPASR